MSPTVSWADPARERAFAAWLAPLATAHGLVPATLRPASADASFRRYLRIDASAPGAASRIIMDAPPPQEDVRPFVQVAALIQDAQLCGPEVLAADTAQGFVLLSDLGAATLLPTLQAAQQAGDSAASAQIMRTAVATLVQWQTRVPAHTLPPYDDALLRRELALFPEWCVQREFGQSWGERQHATWATLCDKLVASALAQPQVAVHRDYMPRNLMAGPPGAVALLDFQDAVRGPASYDIASLLRDAFISWDDEQEVDWCVRYWQAARAAGVALDDDFGEFWRQMEWMGLQRHLKVLGIFCRLKHRDGKPAYAQDLPRFFAYATKVALRWRELAPLLSLIEPLAGQRVQAGYTF